MTEENMLDALINSKDIFVLSDIPEPLCEKGSVIGPRGRYQPAAINDRMENFYNIMEARANPSTVLEINKIPVRKGESIKNMIKKLAKKSKEGETIIMPGKSAYTRRKTPPLPSRPLEPPPVRKGKSQAGPFSSQTRPAVRAPVRQSIPSTATRGAPPAIPRKGPFSSSRKSKGKKYYKKAKNLSKRAKNSFLSKLMGTDK